jgi:hypothetical protein
MEARISQTLRSPRKGRAPALWGMALLLIAGCETEVQRKTAQDAAIRQQGAIEIKRICALPPAERDAEIKKMKEQLGVVLDCGGR